MLGGFDLMILIILLLAFVGGLKKGLIRMLIGLATIILAAIFGGKLAAFLLPYISKINNISPQWANLLAYLAAFMIIALVLSAVGNLIHKLFTIVYLGFINRLIGGIIAIGSAMVVLSILLNLLLIIDPEERLINQKIKDESFFYERVQAVVPAIVPYLNISDLSEIIPKELIDQMETIDDQLHIKIEGNIIDSTYQKEYFETDSL